MLAIDMPSLTSIPERRRGVRVGLQVIHRHQVGDTIFRRVSELLYVNGRPVALIEWINLGGVRTPLYTYPLDPHKLRPDVARRGVFHYDEVTADPRFMEGAGEVTATAVAASGTSGPASRG